MKALETEYRNIRFRSRTEARWAVYLDELRVSYSYEPEGFDLGGEWYLPDFWLPSPGAWLEVKGVEPNDREVRLACLLSKASRSPLLIAVGAPPINKEYPLLMYRDGRFVGRHAFADWGAENLFITNEWGNVELTIRGSVSATSGIPEPATRQAKVAAAQRFGVHDGRGRA